MQEFHKNRNLNKYSNGEKLDFTWIKRFGRKLIAIVDDLEHYAHVFDMFDQEISQIKKDKLKKLESRRKEFNDRFNDLEKKFRQKLEEQQKA